MDAGYEDRWLKGIKSSTLSQAALSVCHLNSHYQLRSTYRVIVDLVSVGLITVSSMIYQLSEDQDADIIFVKL